MLNERIEKKKHRNDSQNISGWCYTYMRIKYIQLCSVKVSKIENKISKHSTKPT